MFPTSLDEVVPQDHLVRVLDEILRALDWSVFEVTYYGRLGAKPILPRVLASVILYRHLTRMALPQSLSARSARSGGAHARGA